MSGLFIAIEGLDAVGKTTTVAHLAARLMGVGRSTPGPAIKPMSRDILAAIGPNQTARCVFYGATVLAEGGRARADADAGAVVIMDRYWLSTLAYARARGVAADLSGIEDAVPRPDVTILLTLDEGERVRRLYERGDMTPADAETLAPEFRHAVHAEMRRAGRDAGLRPIEIDVTGADPAGVVSRILDHPGMCARA